MGKSLTEAARAILLKEDPTPLSATLRPGSTYMDPPKAIPGEVEDLGSAPVAPGQGENMGAAAAGKVKKDTSKSSQSSAMAEELEETGDVVEEDIEISEELSDFIDGLVEEGLSEEEIVDAINENFDVVEEEYDSVELNELAPETLAKYVMKKDDQRFDPKFMYGMDPKKRRQWTNKADYYTQKARKEIFDKTGKRPYELAEDDVVEEDYTVDMSEHIEALFAGEEVSEEFKEKARTIFEAAVMAKIAEEIDIIEQAYSQTIEEESQAIMESLTEDVDKYLNYVVEQWTADNQIAIESGLRTELTEEFISGLRNLFVENYIDVPEDQINVVEELGNSVVELEEKLNEEIERNIELTQMLSESKKHQMINAITEGLIDTHADKLRALAENVEFTTEEQYADKLNTLKENYFPTGRAAVRNSNALDNEPDHVDPSRVILENHDPMAKYVKAIGKSLPR